MARSYVLELERWGITTEIPNKPYTLEHYTKARNNVLGFNNALLWARNNYYNEIVVPRAEYCICYPIPILTQGNTILDFNFSKVKVIYDSDNRSPFDESIHPIYQFASDSILCKTPHTHIINLELVGDREDRSWTSPYERAIEHTNGIKMGVGADNCSIRNCDLSHYMGDAIALYYSPYEHFEVKNTEFGALDYKTGEQVVRSAKTVRTESFIPVSEEIKKFSMIGLGYNPTTTIPNGRYDVFFYTSEGKFISSRRNIRTRDAVQVPKKARNMKMSWEGNGTMDDDCVSNGNPPYWALLVKHSIADNIIIENNEIHRNHRGGIFLGTNNVTIRNNFFHDTGYQGEEDLDGVPTFTDFTKYAINTEDNVGHNCKILDNIFENTRMAVALRGEHNEIRGNEFRHCEYGVILYKLNHCIVDSNFFYFSSLGCYEYENFDRDWKIDNNIFVGRGMELSGSGTVSSVSSNTFEDSYLRSYIHILNCEGNVFNGSIYQVEEPRTVVQGCSFINNSIFKVINKPYSVKAIKGCNFKDSKILGQNSDTVVVKDSVLENSGFSYSTGNMHFILLGSSVKNDGVSLVDCVSPIDVGLVRHSLSVLDSEVQLVDKSLISSMDWGCVDIQKSELTYILSKDLNNAFVGFYGNVKGGVQVKDSTILAGGYEARQTVEPSVELKKDINNVFINFTLRKE